MSKRLQTKIRAILYGDDNAMAVKTEFELREAMQTGLNIGYPAPKEHKGWFYNTDPADTANGYFIGDEALVISEIKNGIACGDGRLEKMLKRIGYFETEL